MLKFTLFVPIPKYGNCVTVISEVSSSTSFVDAAGMIPQTLPVLPGFVQCSPNILLAHDTLNNIYRQALRLVNQEETDPLQLTFHLNVIKDDAVPLLEAMEYSSLELSEWTRQVATQLGQLFRALSNYRDNIQNQ